MRAGECEAAIFFAGHTMTKRLLALSALILATLAGAADLPSRIFGDRVTSVIEGKVISVADGDTVTVLTADRTQVKVRLLGIDCPENGQAFGDVAKRALSRLAFGKVVKVAATGQDAYGRTLGVLIDENGRNLNAEMVQAGMAWHYAHYNPDAPELAEAQKAAQANKRGLWSDPNALAPWEYRTRQKTAAAREKGETPAGGFWLNTSSNVRHNAGCAYYKNTKAGRLCGAGEGKPCGRCGG